MLHSSDRSGFATQKVIVRARSSRPGRLQTKRNSCRLLDRVSDHSRDELIVSFLEALDCSRALTVWMLYKYDSHRSIMELQSDPLMFDDRSPDLFRRHHCATKFLSKAIGLNTGIDLKEVALSSARKAEVQCRSTNERLKKMRSSPHVSGAFGPEFFRAKTLIASILGPLPKSFTDVGWSKGRSSSAFGTEVASIHKYASRPDVTVSSSLMALCLLRDSPHWGSAVIHADGPCSVLSSALTIVSGNTMITVPKSAKTDRVICYEPHMNIRLQLAVGSFMKRRLKKAGVDLTDQSVNQRRALSGSLTGELATIDLSMASDTLALELVYDLLPIDWALHLDDLRSKYTLWPDGSNLKNEKFSSMGNGFTFELESLIFYALGCSVSENVSVYGDDIIVPTQNFQRLSELLEYCGFSLNMTKSYSTSSFRESCGADYFSGSDVTPVYLRKVPKLTEDVVKLHNSVRAYSSRGVAPRRICNVLEKWRRVHTNLHGPSGYGDGHYHVDFDTALPRADHGLDGWWFKTYSRVYRDNTLYGDRLSGGFPDSFYGAALCCTLGPKQVRSVWDVSVDRRLWSYRQVRTLASFTWPEIIWGL